MCVSLCSNVLTDHIARAATIMVSIEAEDSGRAVLRKQLSN